jgi:hypothetical protein
MDYIIKFVGIVMIVSAMGPGDRYRALLPLSDVHNYSCKDANGNPAYDTPKHEAYIRIAKTEIANQLQWSDPKNLTCADNSCMLFHIENSSDLVFYSGFDPGTEVRESPSYCLVPQLRREFPAASQVTTLNEAATIASLTLPGGDLTAERIASNGAIYSSLHVRAHDGADRTKPIVIMAIERTTHTVRVVVANPGATVMVVNATPDVAVLALDAGDPDPHPDPHNHFMLYNKLLNKAENCKKFDGQRPCDSVAWVGTTGSVGCSNSGCCPP